MGAISFADNRLKKTARFLTIILVLISVCMLGRFLSYEYKLLKYPYQLMVRESLQLNHAIIISEGKPLYEITKDPPLAIEPYGPLYPALVAPFIKVLGRSLFAPRLVSLGFFLLLVFFTACAVFSLTRSWRFVLISIGLNVFMLNWARWLLICKPDSLGNFLLFITLFIHWKWPYKKTAIASTLIAGMLGFFSKAYFVSGFGAIVLNYWFIHRDKKMALSYLLYGSAAIIISILAADYITGGLYSLFTFKIMAGWASNSYSFAYLLSKLKELVSYFLPILVLIPYCMLTKSFDYKRYGPFFTHLVVGLPLFAFLLGNPGAGNYYWYCVIPALIVVGCDLIKKSRPGNFKVIIPLLLALILIMGNRGYRDLVRNKLVIPSSELAGEWTPVAELVAAAKGPVMNDDATAILNIHEGKTLFMEGLGYFQSRDYLVRRHGYSFIDVNEQVAQQKFSLIINPQKEIETEVLKYYKPIGSYSVSHQFGDHRHSLDLFVPKTIADL